MRPLAIWLVVVVAVFAGLAIAASLWPEDEAKRVFVVVDASFPMREVWDEVDNELDRIDNRDNTEFALATEKDFIHTWRDNLRLGSVEAFAPCDFDEIEAYAEVAEADELILVTTAGSCDTAAFVDWE
ncbi:MAG: hypothetical protein ACR2QE_09430, partial [Acidimicrobiales bacterium]